MDDKDLVDQVATDYLEKLGRGAIAHLLEMHAAAQGMGDDLSADAWLDIAQAAAIIIKRDAAISDGVSSIPRVRGPSKDNDADLVAAARWIACRVSAEAKGAP